MKNDTNVPHCYYMPSTFSATSEDFKMYEYYLKRWYLDTKHEHQSLVPKTIIGTKSVHGHQTSVLTLGA